jgi:Ser/Thr protein kinase RdoA (MazF antagonist)
MQNPPDIVLAYGLVSAEGAGLEHIPSLINATFRVQTDLGISHRSIILQRLHPVFGAQVHLDIEAVTAHLEAQHLETPRLVRNRDGALWTVETSGEARVWRAQTFIDGLTLHKSRNLAQLASAAELLSRFHHALSSLQHEFVHVRPIHATVKHLETLRQALGSRRARGDEEAQSLGARVLRHAEGVRLDFGAHPRRVVHGDPKLSNLLFAPDEPARARCLIDLDSVGLDHLAYELGDALRSWGNTAGEDTTRGHIDPNVLEAVLSGYARARAPGITNEELLSTLDGVETVSLELASRFAADAIVDAYFGWDATRFPSRRAHNLVRAEGQLSLSQSIRADRAELLAVATRALSS